MWLWHVLSGSKGLLFFGALLDRADQMAKKYIVYRAFTKATQIHRSNRIVILLKGIDASRKPNMLIVGASIKDGSGFLRTT